MRGSDEAKCMLNGMGNLVVHKRSAKAQLSVGLIGMIMDAVVSSCQSEAQGAAGKM